MCVCESKAWVSLEVMAFASPSQKFTASGNFPERRKQQGNSQLVVTLGWVPLWVTQLLQQGRQEEKHGGQCVIQKRGGGGSFPTMMIYFPL